MNKIQLDIGLIAEQLGINKERLLQWKSDYQHDSGTEFIVEEAGPWINSPPDSH
ncbi:hypothetical protein [Paenibacillus cremeus]|uniref:hypothetical protein n=1 Tax=Paenibacillus cremeus TaxID=2163881 RepID=UPI001646CB9F|nr:hypothetical protein [Paenibacillus cremeus]